MQCMISHETPLPPCASGHAARPMLDKRQPSANGGHYIECKCSHTARHESFDVALRDWCQMAGIPVPVVAQFQLAAPESPPDIQPAPAAVTTLNSMQREAMRHGVEPLREPSPVVDPLVIDKAVDKYRRGKRTLAITASHYGVSLVGAHDAGADAVAAGRVAQAIARAYPAELGIDVEELHRLQVRWCQEQAEDFQAYIRRVKDPFFTTTGGWPCR